MTMPWVDSHTLASAVTSVAEPDPEPDTVGSELFGRIRSNCLDPVPDPDPT